MMNNKVTKVELKKFSNEVLCMVLHGTMRECRT
ncbi:Uncharacterised protein [Streptococcus pneumoniae]|nr:Uncharacterised protein [Streptococcus pneumoniae]